MEDLGIDTLELAADAIFPLVLSEPAAFQSLGEHLMSKANHAGLTCTSVLLILLIAALKM
jgi:hypothetical protein